MFFKKRENTGFHTGASFPKQWGLIMAGTERLQHINNTPLEYTLKKIEQVTRTHNEQAEEQGKIVREKQAIQQLTDAFLIFANRFFPLSKKMLLSTIEQEECQMLCENLLLQARQKQRLPLRICGTAAIWAFWVAAVILPFIVFEDKMTAQFFGIVVAGICGGMVALISTAFIWEGNNALSFLHKYNECLSFTSKPGVLMIEHAREVAQEKNPQQS